MYIKYKNRKLYIIEKFLKCSLTRNIIIGCRQNRNISSYVVAGIFPFKESSTYTRKTSILTNVRYRYQAVKVLNLRETISNNRLCRDESFLPRCFCSLVLIRRFDEIPGENRNNANESFDVRVRSVRKERTKPTMFEWRLPSERQHQRNRKFCHSFYFPAWACEQLGHSIFFTSHARNFVNVPIFFWSRLIYENFNSLANNRIMIFELWFSLCRVNSIKRNIEQYLFAWSFVFVKIEHF